MTLIKRDTITGRAIKTHGGSKSREYSIWANMIYRCHTISSNHYKNYGNKGITVCPRWLVYQNFINDMGIRPNSSYSIDRIDNTKGYFKNNCRWASKKEQAVNRTNTIFIQYKDQPLTVEQLALELNIPITTIKNRLRRNWSHERIITTPKNKYRIATC